MERIDEGAGRTGEQARDRACRQWAASARGRAGSRTRQRKSAMRESRSAMGRPDATSPSASACAHPRAPSSVSSLPTPRAARKAALPGSSACATVRRGATDARASRTRNREQQRVEELHPVRAGVHRRHEVGPDAEPQVPSARTTRAHRRRAPSSKLRAPLRRRSRVRRVRDRCSISASVFMASVRSSPTTPSTRDARRPSRRIPTGRCARRPRRSIAPRSLRWRTRSRFAFGSFASRTLDIAFRRCTLSESSSAKMLSASSSGSVRRTLLRRK